MKILIVCSGKPSNPKWSFELNRSYVYEQAESLIDLEYDTYIIEGNGLIGYLKNYPAMIKKIKSYKPDLIHAHYGLSGLLANLQRKVHVITTFHGSDINVPFIRIFSYIASKMSIENIFVHEDQPRKIFYKKDIHLIPCGVDRNFFYPLDKYKSRKILGLEIDKNYALFTGAFTNNVKNYSLAKEAIAQSKYNIELLELKGYTREEVKLLMNAVDFLLMTSLTEGSPMVIKEAMCCNCPIVSVDVGDVKNVVSDTEGCCVTSYDADEISKSIDMVLELDSKTTGREKMEKYSLEKIASKVFKIYKNINENKGSK